MKYLVWNNFHNVEIKISIPFYIPFNNCEIMQSLSAVTGKNRKIALRKRREIIKKTCPDNCIDCFCITKIGGEPI